MGVTTMARKAADLLQGSLDLLVLKTLSWGPAHGYAIARWIEHLSGSTLQIGEGSLYPELHLLEERGWIESEWRTSENNRRARFYRLLSAGRKQLREETSSWEEFAGAITKILRTRSAPDLDGALS
jgi:PadR family transcriptional regulator PadR